MRFKAFNIFDIPTFEKWFHDNPELLKSTMINNTRLDPNLIHEFYLIFLDNGDAIGWFSLINITIKDTAEFGLAMPNKQNRNMSSFHAVIGFLKLVFEQYELKSITTGPTSPKIEKIAQLIGFKNGLITLKELKRKWF
jgi:hypothetical protein